MWADQAGQALLLIRPKNIAEIGLFFNGKLEGRKTCSGQQSRVPNTKDGIKEVEKQKERAESGSYGRADYKKPLIMAGNGW